MSGHSKWKTNKGKKGIADAKRGATFTKIIKELVVVARDGGGNAWCTSAVGERRTLDTTGADAAATVTGGAVVRT